MRRPRILLADDHELILEGLRTVLEPVCDILGDLTDGKSLVDAALRLTPDLIVLDIAMPRMSGLEAAVEIKRALPHVKLIFVTMHSGSAYIQAALNAGATGYVLKSSAREEIPLAVDTVMAGGVYITRSLGVGPSGEGHSGEGWVPGLEGSGLTARELEILRLVARGLTTKEMAAALCISSKTVAFHKDNVKRRLGLHSTADLTKYAIQEGML